MVSPDQLAPLPGSSSLEQQAYRAIKDAILTLRFKPGEALVEAELAERLGVSKTPVREALSDLEKEGLVVRILHKGTYVSKITKQDICEIFELRAVLEGLAARLAASRFTRAELLSMESILKNQEDALKQGDMEQASQQNRQFHAAIIQKSGQQRLLVTLANFEDHLQRFRVLSDHLNGRLYKSSGEHGKVFAALRSKDPDAAESAMRAHLHSVLDDLAQAYIPEIEQS